MSNRSVSVARVVAFLSLLTMCGSVSAFPVTWTLSGVTFVDGGTASGSFVYDADTNNVSGILDTYSISVAGGDTLTFPPVTYDVSNSNGFVADQGGGDFGAIFTLNDSHSGGRGIRIPAISVLTDAGGTLAINAAGSGAGECYNCGPQRSFASGNLIGTAAPNITSAASANVAVNAVVDFTVTATGAPIPTLTVFGALPTGVTFADNGDGSGTFSGQSTDAGAFALTITASNGVSPDATQPFSLTVQAAAPPPGPVPTLGEFGLLACGLLLLAAAWNRIAQGVKTGRK